MRFKRTSPFSGEVNYRDIEVTREQLQAWSEGTKIQDAMPNISADEREFIMTGITPAEWDETFKENDYE